MPSITEAMRAGDFLLSEANGSLSRDNEILASGQSNLPAGTVLGKVTASGKFVVIDPTKTDGSQSAAAILWAGADAASADTAVVVIARSAEVKADALTWPAGITTPQKTAAIVQLEALGIVLR